MKEQETNIEALIQDDKNFNRGTEEGQRLMNQSLERFGAGRSILIDQNNRIIAGNKTAKTYEALGRKKVRIIETTGDELIAVKRTDIDLDSPEGREMALADNATAKANLEWDEEVLQEVGISFEDWGVDFAEGVEVEETPAIEQGKEEIEGDEFDEDKETIEQKVSRGDVWQLGEHRLMCGDSTSAEDIAKLMNRQHAELLFTSPPYSDMRTYNGSKDLDPQHLANFIRTYSSYTNYECVNLGLQIKNYELNTYWDWYIAIAKDCGLKLLGWNVWNKRSAGAIVNQANFIVPCIHEWIFVFGSEYKNLNRTWEKNEASIIEGTVIKKIRNNDGTFHEHSSGDHSNKFKKMESIVEINAERGTIRSLHPATFPVELPSEYIQAFTDKGDNVIEPFCGSGTTLIACEQLDRHCYGMELDPHYCDVIIARWEKLTGQKAVKL